jgi:hypothetical protein
MNEFITKSENEELIKRINEGDILLGKITKAYNEIAMKYNKASSERESMKVVIRQLFNWLEDGTIVESRTFPKEQIDNAIEIMHDDPAFFEELVRWFADHIDNFGENYELEFDKE